MGTDFECPSLDRKAFHWCLDYGKALSEFARVLGKDGAIVFIWNCQDRSVFVDLFRISSSYTTVVT